MAGRVVRAVACGALVALPQLHAQEDSPYVVGGSDGVPWSQTVDFQVMVDDTTASPAIQPRELVPGENLLPQLGPWWERRTPKDPVFRDGHPRAWQGVNATAFSEYTNQTQTRRWVDGDATTFTELWDVGPHFYTLDLGAPVYADRLLFHPPFDGVSDNTGDPFYPKYALQKFQLYGAPAETSGQLLEESVQGLAYDPRVDWHGTDMCCALETLLGAEDSNADTVTAIDFALQPLRFFRLLLLADSFRANGTPVIDFWANAEIEVHGRGFAPQALWESTVIDLGQGQPVTIGRVFYDVTHMHRDPETGELSRVNDGVGRVAVELQTGNDGDPVAHYIYNDLGGLSEAPRDVWMALEDADILGATEGPGFRGPRAEDRDNWSFWSQPLPASGSLARMPGGRYLRLRLRLQSSTPWDFARVHSVRLERGPLLAARILGEVTGGAPLAGSRDLPLLRAGQAETIVLALRADFSSAAQLGFDGLRITAPLEMHFDSLAVGETDDNLDVVRPDSVVAEAGGLALYLPPDRRIRRRGDRHVRVFLRVLLFGAAGELTVEVFDRTREHLAQQAADGDASEVIASNRMLVVAAKGTGTDKLGPVAVTPPVLTPQGDGINDVVRIEFTVFHAIDPAPVRVSVHRLDGTEVWRAPARAERAGRRAVEWNGSDHGGRRVAPGLYLVRVEVDTEAGRESRVRSIAVAY